MLDIYRLTQTFRIAIAPSGHKHARRGWVNVACPFHVSDTPGYHLGFNLEKGYFFCWACGWHPLDLAVASLTKKSREQARSLLREFNLIGTQIVTDRDVKKSERIVWPPSIGPMSQRHKVYLATRRFDPDRLEQEWGLRGTENWGHYMFRIIAPITFRGEVVSWQGRDITGRQVAKYLPCPEEDEVLSHKHVLYGLDRARWRIGVVVEGITGVWRLGPGAVATFGVEFTPSQLLLIGQTFDEVRIFYDGDDAGQRAAEKMARDLGRMGKEVEIIEPLNCDSGDIPQSMADEIMKEVRSNG